MNQEQLNKMKTAPGFIAALDQSGGSSPKALELYGVTADQYDNDTQMFELVHAMRTRIITSPAFDGNKIIGAILFEHTMENKINGKFTAEYLWEDKHIIPFVKVDEGLAERTNGVQLMKPMPHLQDLLARANKHHVFGTKMRSVIYENDAESIQAVVEQQFEFAKQILAAGLVPIIEPEVNIDATDKVAIEAVLKQELIKHLGQLTADQPVMLKLTIPTEPDSYQELVDHPRVIRVVALSGGYPVEEANDKLKHNHGIIASFSRALSQKLRVDQSEETFNATLKQAVDSIYDASVNKV